MGERRSDQIAGDVLQFGNEISSYAGKLRILLEENPWAFWRKRFWTYGHWARRDSELQKIIARAYGLLHEVLRHNALGGAGGSHAGAPGLSDSDRQRIWYLLDENKDPASLTLDAALELFDALDHIMVEIGDAQYVCAEVEGELQKAAGSTTWLTWGTMYGTSVPDAVKIHNSGQPVPGGQLDAARNQLLTFRTERTDEYRVHRARQKMRARNLRVLALVLLPLVVAFGWLLHMRNIGESLWGVLLVGVVGALGSVIAGTIKARDKLVRGSDLRAFRAGLFAQVLLGAASSLVLLLLLSTSILAIAGTESLEGKAAVGFVAGLSEPYFLGIVAQVATMGKESGNEGNPAAPV